MGMFIEPDHELLTHPVYQKSQFFRLLTLFLQIRFVMVHRHFNRPQTVGHNKADISNTRPTLIRKLFNFRHRIRSTIIPENDAKDRKISN